MAEPECKTRKNWTKTETTDLCKAAKKDGRDWKAVSKALGGT